MILDLSKIHPKLPKPKLTAGIVAAVATAIGTAILNALGVDLAATLLNLGDTAVSWQAALTVAASWLGTYLAPEPGPKLLKGNPEDDDGRTTLGSPSDEYPPGGGAGPRGEAPDA